MYEVVKQEAECLTIKNAITGETMTFSSWYDINQFNEIAAQFKNEMITF